MFYYFIILFLLKSCLTLNNNNEQCSIRNTCTNSSIESPSVYDNEDLIQSRNCFCDSVCEQYGDCCYKTKVLKNNYECVDFLLPTITNKIVPFNRLFIWMRTECLSIYIGSQVDVQCRNLNNQLFNDNPILFIPVTSLQTNITYRNYYCAYCNNDINKNIQSWEYKPFCYGDGSENDYKTLKNDLEVQYFDHMLKNCTKTIVYPHERGNSRPSVFIRSCKKPLPTTCPIGTSIDLARNCSSSSTTYRYIKNSTIIYHNPYCAECNHPNNSDDITCFDPNLRSALPAMNHLRTRPLSILFDPNLLKRYLNNDTIPRFIYSINYNCTKSNELYDLVEQECRKITNSSEEFIISMKCSYLIQTSIQLDDKIFQNNGSIYLTNYSVLLKNDEYVFISENRIVFCSDRWRHMKPSLDYSTLFPFYRNVLSVICTSISLVCLFIFVIIFWLVPSLHNLPGKCLLCLSISLFLGQLIFLLTSSLTDSYSLCFTSAILIHYFYLSSFFWLLIISIHIHSTFNHQIIRDNTSNKTYQRLIAYNILVWCLTGIIILIACLIQFTIPQSSFSPAYATIFCTISKPYAMILFFLLPIGCTLLIVGILFVKTLLAIYHSHNIAKLANTTSSSNINDKNLVFIYARLASLMGIQWILLIIALAIGQTWSWIIFEIINSLPGLFICFGFLCSKRVFTILKEKFSKKLIPRRQSSTNTTSSTMIISPSSITKKFLF
ncbi:unnamed protein product [Adineta steineri]|uniref:G-protein coupled receptors family 2 profile 2 domain-containing protein n=1 Tax=Adineta steineri TaxID=433720 RepID=A0A818U0T5_9BILA|nr:unnamed protein product [Adineta steineri]